MKKGEINNHNKKYFNEDFFKGDSEEVFYWAGYIAADGCVYLKRKKNKRRDDKYYPVINIVSIDKEHLEKFKLIVEAEKPLYKKSNGFSEVDGRELTAWRIELHSSVMMQDLEERFGIGQRKSLTYKFPKQIKNHKYLKHFMRGYFDGDGGFYMNSNRKCLQMTCRIVGSIDFLTHYKEILERETGIESVSKPYMYNGIGALNYGGNLQLIKIADYLYGGANIYLERKFKQIDEIPRHEHLGISKITEEEFKKLYLEHGSLTPMAKALNCHHFNLQLLVKKYGLKEFCAKHRDYSHLKKPGRTKPTKEELINAFTELKSTNKVAHKFDYSVDSIRIFRKEYNIPDIKYFKENY